jgi:Zn-dependent protease with chaperone function
LFHGVQLLDEAANLLGLVLEEVAELGEFVLSEKVDYVIELFLLLLPLAVAGRRLLWLMVMVMVMRMVAAVLVVIVVQRLGNTIDQSAIIEAIFVMARRRVRPERGDRRQPALGGRLAVEQRPE